MSIQNISPSLQAYINNPKPKEETAVVSNSIEKTDTFTPSNTNEVKEANEVNEKEENGIIDKIKNMPTIGKVIGGIAVAGIAIGGACLIFKGKGDKAQEALQGTAQGILDQAKGVENEAQGLQETAQGIIDQAEGVKERAQGILKSMQEKAQGILKQAEGVQETAEKIQQDGQKAYSEIMEIIRQGQEKGFCDLVQDGKTIKFIIPEGEGKLPSTIEEYIGETVSRKSSLIETDGKLVPKTIEEFIEGTKKTNQYIFNGDSVSEFYKGIEEGADGAIKWAEKYSWDDGKLSKYIKGYSYKRIVDNKTKKCKSTTKYAEGYSWCDGKLDHCEKGYESNAPLMYKCAEEYRWDDGKLSKYTISAGGTEKLAESYEYSGGVETCTKNYERSADGTVKPAERCIWRNGKLSEYTKGYERSADGAKKWAERYQLGDDGKLTSCVKGYEEGAGVAKKWAEEYSWHNGKLSEYTKGYEFSDFGTEKWAERYSWDDGKLSEYTKGYEFSDFGTEKWAERYELGYDGKLHSITPKAESAS